MGYEYDHLQDKHRLQQNIIRKAKPENIQEIANLKRDYHTYYQDGHENKVTSVVPPLIKLIHPKLRDETYKQLKKDPYFLKKTAIVCEGCLLDIKRSQEDGITAEPAEEIVGRGKLRPDILKGRRDVRSLRSPLD